MQLQEL